MIMKFRATIRQSGKTATGIEVPPEVVEGLGSSKRPAVSVTLGDYTYRTTIAPMGGRYMIPVSADVRKNAGVAANDTLDVRVELDTAPREITVPDDFKAALAAGGAQEFFESLSFSAKQWHVLQIEGAKTAETRQRRIQKSVETLASGRAR
jgi:hypothetical protein